MHLLDVPSILVSILAFQRVTRISKPDLFRLPLVDYATTLSEVKRLLACAVNLRLSKFSGVLGCNLKINTVT